MTKKKTKSKEAIKKEAYSHFGAVVRALHDLGVKKELTPHIQAILKALK